MALGSSGTSRVVTATTNPSRSIQRAVSPTPRHRALELAGQALQDRGGDEVGRKGDHDRNRSAHAGEGPGGGDERLHRRLDQAGADLADARVLWAMPVLTVGRTPVWTTSRASMPSGVPRKPRVGTWYEALSAQVMSYIARVAATASSGLPPTKRTMAGAAAMAIPPMPMVSVMVESPMSRLASSGPNPGR